MPFIPVVSNIRNYFSKKAGERDKEYGAVDYGDYDYHDGGGSIKEMTKQIAVSRDIVERYRDYEDMADYPTLARALDVVSDDASQYDMLAKRHVWADSKDRNIESILNDLYLKLGLEDDTWGLTRSMCKYGNDFEMIVLDEGGVKRLDYLPPAVTRKYERDGVYAYAIETSGAFSEVTTNNVFRAIDDKKAGKQSVDGSLSDRVIEGWQVAHFKLAGKNRGSVYGDSFYESARWIWKRLQLLEDSYLMHELMNAQDRLAFYINVGTKQTKDALSYVNSVKNRIKKSKYVNKQTGKLDLRFNPPGVDENFWIPVKDGKDGTRIESVGGSGYRHTDILEYFNQKLYTSINVPKAFLGYEDVLTSKAVASIEDVRFARAVMRVQNAVREGFTHVSNVHLAARSINPDYVDYETKMTPPSYVFEQAQIEILQMRTELASQMGAFVSNEWIMKTLFNFKDDEVKTILDQRREETIANFGLDAINSALVTKASMDPDKFLPNKMSGPSPTATATANAAAGMEQGMEPVGGGEGEPPAKESIVSSFYKRRRYSKYPLNQRNLFQGNREHEKMLEDNLEEVLNSNKQLLAHFSESKKLMQEIKKGQHVTNSGLNSLGRIR